MSFSSKTIKLDPTGYSDNTYSLPFLISCTGSEKLSKYLSKRQMKLILRFTGTESVRFYAINLKTNEPNYIAPQDFIEFSCNNFSNPNDAFCYALITIPINRENINISFSYSITEPDSTRKEYHKAQLKNITNFNSVHSDHIICKK